MSSPTATDHLPASDVPRSDTLRPARPLAWRPWPLAEGRAARPDQRLALPGSRLLRRQAALVVLLALLILGVALHSASTVLVEVDAASGDLRGALWRVIWPLGLALAAAVAVALAVIARAGRHLRRDLDAVVSQANALREGHFETRGLASTPELAPLTESMNLLVGRLRAVFDAQAEQLEVMHSQAHADPLTGLANRRHFMARLEQVLASEDAAAEVGLLLLRMRDLQGMNQRIGHAATDHVLQALAQTLQAYPRRVDGCFAGRLNGADFALLLPAGGIADETARSVLEALRQPLSQIDPAACVSVGAVELRRPTLPRDAMAQADEALARAEGRGPFAVVCVRQAADAAPRGESSWQRRIVQALEQGRVTLAEYAVGTPDGRLLHLDCPMRVQLETDELPQPAARWLSQAARGHLCPRIDERALVLALAEIERDGRARCINFAAQSLASAEFMAMVSRRLEASPEAACRLWIDLPEALALDRPALVREASRRWRPMGVMLGLEHAGDGLGRIQRLIDLGLDCVRIDGRYVNGLTGDDAADARRYLQGLVRLVQSVGLSITAEGVRSVEDVEQLWRMGFDAATGPALSLLPQDD